MEVKNDTRTAASPAAAAFYNPDPANNSAADLSFLTDTVGQGGGLFREMSRISAQFINHNQANAQSDLRFFTTDEATSADAGNPSLRMVIAPEGNVGIGTETPALTSPTNGASTGNLTVNDIFLLSTNAWASEGGGGSASQMVTGYFRYAPIQYAYAIPSVEIEVDTQTWRWRMLTSTGFAKGSFVSTTVNPSPLTLGSVFIPTTLYGSPSTYSTNNVASQIFVIEVKPTSFKVRMLGGYSYYPVDFSVVIYGS
ncbi:MAG: hypothetical protein COV76_03935 [Candidatus Omnitrophica bacterium CG11_big_fil_rev_8_21_14_0_20_64_10]|nr:MAG: hypothetical protein COV76_03935 [Candidatus Omnitrophica bacterium CG11_big_fil_rev_8_21_14_0_20_64_10]